MGHLRSNLERIGAPVFALSDDRLERSAESQHPAGLPAQEILEVQPGGGAAAGKRDPPVGPPGLLHPAARLKGGEFSPHRLPWHAGLRGDARRRDRAPLLNGRFALLLRKLITQLALGDDGEDEHLVQIAVEDRAAIRQMGSHKLCQMMMK